MRRENIYITWDYPLFATWHIEAERNVRHFADFFKCIFLNLNCCILDPVLLKFVTMNQINTKSKAVLVQIMAWYIAGENALTHWGRDKMAALFQTKFSNTFLE